MPGSHFVVPSHLTVNLLSATLVFSQLTRSIDSTSPHGLQNYPSLIAQSASIRGFILTDYVARFEEARVKLGEWLGQGKLKRKFHVQEGLKDAPKHLEELFEGKNTGKM